MGETREQSVLVVEDEELMRNILRELLEDEGYSVLSADSAESGLEIFASSEVSVIITDIKMSGMDGIELLDRIKQIDENALVIIITAYSSVDSAVAALRKGAYDYVTKPFVNEDLIQTVKNAIRLRELFSENRVLKRELDRKTSFDGIIGNSDALQSVFRIVEKVADSNAHVLIQGESGTGKELFARALHQKSSRADKPFLAVNCGALPETLLESELFGHKKGSFTGATSDKKGLFRSADGGTLFLDEIGEMPQPLQVKLLRAVQEQEVTPVGGSEPVTFDVRIVAATNKDLEKEVAEKRFREDLFYRLNVVEINVPPLRERREDIPLLAKHFAARTATEQNADEKPLSTEAMSALVNHKWQGNVRELMNAIERAYLLSSEEIDLESLPPRIKNGAEGGFEIRDPNGIRPTLDEIERRYILETLQAVKNDKAAAAEILGIDLSTLYRKLKKYNEI
ncbi:MAG: sigma-54-dependent Fis family transcriptional regulator [Acidobacteria bacterium]|nr:MAG: sigma-54-dependent Fis family transcriptional regulator [Acidobacteriota bacterium]REK01759.1 MAG: sigma-54-dependent Fis family transcriptional regulator [Acidobacteriota bacterium]REK14715.1 MAG: sigma-54-dependent Fis family transcriptional regulator [Acidobacteriota bacterium]REK45430.1 MAG: sigma-54-dependent Fis family transcriptional regulator [Acidobacteriota bacterium]